MANPPRQVIVYDRNTREVLWVLDHENQSLSDQALQDIAGANIAPHHAMLIYPKQGGGQDHIHAWREAVRHAP